MEFIARKITRDTNSGSGIYSIGVNPVTHKITFSAALRRRLDLEKKQVGFGYSPNTENATRAGLYIVDEGGCVVSATGGTQSKYHTAMLNRIFNNGDATAFTVSVADVAEEVTGNNVYWLSPEASDIQVSETPTDTFQEEEEAPISSEEAVAEATADTPDPVFPSGTL